MKVVLMQFEVRCDDYDALQIHRLFDIECRRLLRFFRKRATLQLGRLI